MENIEEDMLNIPGNEFSGLSSLLESLVKKGDHKNLYPFSDII